MKAKKENKLGSAADGECTDLNGINGCDVDVDVDGVMTQEVQTQVNTGTCQETAFQVTSAYILILNVLMIK